MLLESKLWHSYNMVNMKIFRSRVLPHDFIETHELMLEEYRGLNILLYICCKLRVNI